MKAQRFVQYGRAFSALLLILMIMTISSCGGLLSPVKMGPTYQYTLDPVFQVTVVPRARQGQGGTILVAMPIASPGYDTTQMAYQEAPYRLDYFSEHRWVGAPPALLMPVLSRALMQTHFFHAVVMTPFSGVTRYRLDTHIDRLQQNFLTQPSHAQLAVRVTLYDNQRLRIVASHRFYMTLKTTADNPVAGVDAMNQAVSRLARQVAAFVVHAL